MPVFVYRGKNRAGTKVTGEQMASNKGGIGCHAETPADQCHESLGKGQGIFVAHLRKRRQAGGDRDIHAPVLRHD